MPLSPTQIAAMRTAHTNAANAQDPAIYWQALSQHYVFGTLALGVVRDNTLSGILTNNYAENKLVNDLGGTFKPQQRKALSMQIMEGDFALREARSGEELSQFRLYNHNDYPSVGARGWSRNCRGDKRQSVKSTG